LEDLHFELKAIKPENKPKNSVKYKKLYDMLRCPECLKKNKDHDLKKSGKYLICPNKNCGRKFQLLNDIPNFTTSQK
jgi:uncharacterized protein YbaR (Trm112 family)